MTDRQIFEVYLRPKPGSETEMPEAKTEQDVRGWLQMVMDWQKIPEDKAKEIIEAQVAKWRASNGEVEQSTQ